MIYGLDLLGSARYPDVAVREFPDKWAFGVFFNVDGFGLAIPVLQSIAKTGRAPIIRVQLMWKDNHQFSEKDFPEIVKRAKRVNRMAARYKGIQFFVSGACEHNLRKDAAAELARRCRAAAPLCTYVNSPSHHFGGQYINLSGPMVINECHGHEAPPTGRYFYSFDGTGCVDSNVPEMMAKHAKAEVFFFWTYQFNLLKNDNDSTKRKDRKAVPTSDLIDSVVYLHRPKGKASLPRKWLAKSHSDQHSAPVPEPRALKPVYIVPPKAPRLELVADNGQVVAVSGARQPFADGRWRYYFDQFGYVIAEKARRIQGHPVLKLRANGKVRGTVNPAHRENEWRK